MTAWREHRRVRVRRPGRSASLRRPRTALFVVVAVVAACYALAVALAGDIVPVSAAVLPIMLAGFYLRLRLLLQYYLVLVAAIALALLLRGGPLPVAELVVVALAALLVTGFVRSRQALGVQGTVGEAMLVELRDRLRAQAGPPPLPRGWRLQSALRSANGAAFSGDFVLASRREWPAGAGGPSGAAGSGEPSGSGGSAGSGAVGAAGVLELALVDVSGKGQPAGTRALLLSGALGGLLGATSPAGFLPAANTYLLRQDWGEGFATAVHVWVDLCSGQYAIRAAGHPPAVHYAAGPGRWRVLPTADDPALGLVPGAEFAVTSGALRRGDALVLYSDGLVENRARDLSFGIDRLSGALARLQRRGFRRAAEVLVDQEWANEDDDRTVVILSRH